MVVMDFDLTSKTQKNKIDFKILLLVKELVRISNKLFVK